MAFPPLPAATSVWAIPGQLAGASGAEQESDRNEKEKSILVFLMPLCRLSFLPLLVVFGFLYERQKTTSLAAASECLMRISICYQIERQMEL